MIFKFAFFFLFFFGDFSELNLRFLFRFLFVNVYDHPEYNMFISHYGKEVIVNSLDIRERVK